MKSRKNSMGKLENFWKDKKEAIFFCEETIHVNLIKHDTSFEQSRINVEINGEYDSHLDCSWFFLCVFPFYMYFDVISSMNEFFLFRKQFLWINFFLLLLLLLMLGVQNIKNSTEKYYGKYTFIISFFSLCDFMNVHHTNGFWYKKFFLTMLLFTSKLLCATIKEFFRVVC